MPFEADLPEAIDVLALNRALRDATAQEILAAALACAPGRVAVVSSFGSESVVLLHMLSRIDPAAPVLFLDTGQLFAQTLDYRRSVVRRLGLADVRDLRPAFADIAVHDPRADLYKTDANACCAVRKVAPLDLALRDFDAWITGRKRFHGGGRVHLPVVERSEGKVKFNPLAGWSKAELDAYVGEHALPPHPLVASGYASLGCWPCTKPTEDPSDVRSGRWAGSEKTECGIHTLRRRPDPTEDDIGGGI
ncbi:MAG: phosphoadenylyl-sulfate reductase [Caulobacteraceae bacterium]